MLVAGPGSGPSAPGKPSVGGADFSGCFDGSDGLASISSLSGTG